MLSQLSSGSFSCGRSSHPPLLCSWRVHTAALDQEKAKWSPWARGTVKHQELGQTQDTALVPAC